MYFPVKIRKLKFFYFLEILMKLLTNVLKKLSFKWIKTDFPFKKQKYSRKIRQCISH